MRSRRRSRRARCGRSTAGDHVLRVGRRGGARARPFCVSGARPASARSPLSRQSVAAATAASVAGAGASAGVRRSGAGADAVAPGCVVARGVRSSAAAGRELAQRAAGRTAVASPRRPSVADAHASPGAGRPAAAARSAVGVAAAAAGGGDTQQESEQAWRDALARPMLFGDRPVSGRRLSKAADQLDSSPARPGAGAELVERRDDVGIELRARAAADLPGRVLDRPGLLVGALVDEDVEHVGDRDEPRRRAGSPRRPGRPGSRCRPSARGGSARSARRPRAPRSRRRRGCARRARRGS